MIDIQIDGTDVFAKTLDNMQHAIAGFSKTGMAAEMSDWQTQDMHRRRPFTMKQRGKARTVVRPHSLRETLGQRRFLRKVYRKAIKAGTITVPKARRGRRRRRYERFSTRAILRAELLQELFTREVERLHRVISWKAAATADKSH